MSLSKEIILSVSDYAMRLSGNLNFYVNDTLDLIFILTKWGVENAKSKNNADGFDLTDITAYLMIENGNQSDSIESVSIINNKIIFKLTKQYTMIPGIGRMQLKLVDSDGCELKLPPFKYEIQNTINEWSDLNPFNEKVLATNTNEPLLTEDGKLLLMSITPSSNPNILRIGDLETSDSVNYDDYTVVNVAGKTVKVPIAAIKCSISEKINISRIPELTHQISESDKKIQELASKGTVKEVLEATAEEFFNEKINNGGLANLTIGANSITEDKYKDESITNRKIKNVSVDKITNTLVNLSEFTNWGSNSGVTMSLLNDILYYDLSVKADRGILSKTLKLQNESYEYLYITADVKSSSHINVHLFSETGKVLTVIGDLLVKSSETFIRKTIKISRDKIRQYAQDEKVKIAICIHDVGNFAITNVGININGLSGDLIGEIKDSKQIKDTSIEGRHIKENTIGMNHLMDECVSDKHITSVDVKKITSVNYARLDEFVKWGRGSGCDLLFDDGELYYNLSESRDGGVISNTINMSNVAFSDVYFHFTIKGSVKIDAHIFDSSGGYLGALGVISNSSTDDGYIDVTLSMSRDKLLKLTPNLKFKLVISIHSVGLFKISRLKIGTTDTNFSNLSEIINDLYIKTNETKPVIMSSITNDSIKGLYTGKNMVKWGSKSTFAYDENDDVITFSHVSSEGNTGFQTVPFAYKHDSMRLYMEGEVLTLSSGALSVFITGLKLSDKTRAYIYFDKIAKSGKFHIDINVKKILSGQKDPIDINSIQILIANNQVVAESSIKNFIIYNKFYDFKGDTLNDVLNNLSYTNIKTHDTIFADINNKDDFSGIWGANYTHVGNTIQFSYLKDSGNACVITKNFVSKTNFIRVVGKITSIAKHSTDKAGIHVYLGGKNIDGVTKYLTIGQLFEVSSFNYLVDLNYHVVYNKLDLNQPVYVMFGNINQVTATFEDVCVKENELSDLDILGDDLKDTLVKIDTEIKSIKNKQPSSQFTGDIKLVSPNGDKFMLNVSDNGVLNATPMIPNKILFIGNSLLNGHGSFGMSASNSKNDYYYHIMTYLKQFKPNIISKKIPGSPWEGSEEKSKATEWITKNINTQDSDYDMVIVQLGDNVNTEAKHEVFKTSCKELLQGIRRHMPKARVAWAGAWYSNSTKQEIMIKSCEETGCKFVNIRDLSTTENQGRIGDVITRDDGSTFTVSSSGVASHPGNKGMKAVADRLIESLFN